MQPSSAARGISAKREPKKMKPSVAPTILKTNVIGTKTSIHLRAPSRGRLDPDSSAGSVKEEVPEQRT